MYVMKLKYLIAPFVLAAAALCGCQETAEIHPVAYMTDAQKTVSKSVTIDTPPAGTEISVSGVQVPDWTAGGNGSADLK